MSSTLRDKASEIRNPQPYKRVRTAISLKPIHSFLLKSLALAITLKASCASIALGRLLGRRGEMITLRAEFSKISFWLSQ